MLPLFSTPWQHRGLITELVRREVHKRFRGSVLGLAWMFVVPLALLLVFSLVFGAIFQARWPGSTEVDSSFVVNLFFGIVIYTLFADVLGKAATVVVENANLVKKVVFPTEILPLTLLFAALVQLGASMLLLLGFAWISGVGVALEGLLLPLLLLPLLLIVTGLALMVASVGVYLRDIGQFVTLLVSAAMFLSPVFYPMQMVPDYLVAWLYLNPLTFVLEAGRGLLFSGALPSFAGFIGYSVVAVLVYGLGWWLFLKLKPGFSDSL